MALRAAMDRIRPSADDYDGLPLESSFAPILIDASRAS
jgi:hypothetical protein